MWHMQPYSTSGVFIKQAHKAGAAFAVSTLVDCSMYYALRDGIYESNYNMI